MQKLKDLKVVIVSHVFATGPAQELEKYLVNKQIKELNFVGLPFSYCEVKNPFLKKYHGGKLIKEKNYPVLGLPGLLFHFKDTFLTLWLILINGFKADLYVGADCLNAFSGLLLKKLGIVRKIIFYTIDYIPVRFKNKLLNNFYHWLDSCCVKNCDQTWNLSGEMLRGREENGLSKKYRSKQVVVPIGTDSKAPKLPFDEINRYEIAFMGHLREKQGVEFLISVLPAIINRIPQVKLLIIGTGPLEEKLKEQVRDLRLTDKVKFTGYIEDHGELQNKLSKCAIAVAPYVDDEKTFTKYADPGKPKAYLASALPVVITKVPSVAAEIEENKCGFAVNYNQDELIEAIVKLLSNDNLLKTYRNNALKFSEKYNWTKIFDNALKAALE